MSVSVFPSSQRTSDVGRAKVLIAEDSAVTQDILKLLLEARGHEVTVAHDGKQALKLLTGGSFDVALLDFHMPRMNGIDVVREFTRQDRKGHAPLFVAMTADVEGLGANEDCATAFSRVLAKPFEFSEVFDLIEDCLGATDDQPEPHEMEIEPAPPAAEVISIYEPSDQEHERSVVAHDSSGPKQAGLPNVRYLSWPSDFGPHGFSPAVSRQLIAGRKYDAIVIAEPCEISDLEMLWKAGELCLLPVLDRTGTLGAKADVNLKGRASAGVGHDAIVRTIDDFGLARLKVHSDLTQSKDPADKLLARIYLTGQELTPVHHGDSMLGLTHRVALADTRVVELAEKLARQDLLERTFFDRFHVCPACESSRLNAREECLGCRSPQLQESALIHHFRCAHQAPEDGFRKGSDLVCPKCNHELRHFGIEYDKPGVVMACASCGNASSDVIVGFKCLDCLTHTDGETITTRDRFAYRLTQKGVTYVEEGRMAIGAETNLRFADLPLPLVVDINKAARAFNEEGAPFSVISVSYPLRHRLTAEHGAREFHLGRIHFLRELRDGFDEKVRVHAGADVDYLVIFDVDPAEVRATLSERTDDALLRLKHSVMPTPVLFGPADLTG